MIGSYCGFGLSRGKYQIESIWNVTHFSVIEHTLFSQGPVKRRQVVMRNRWV